MYLETVVLLLLHDCARLVSCLHHQVSWWQHSPWDVRMDLHHFLQLPLPWEPWLSRCAWLPPSAIFLLFSGRASCNARTCEIVFPRNLATLIVSQRKLQIPQSVFSVTFAVAQNKELTLTRRRQRTTNSTTPPPPTPPILHHSRRTFNVFHNMFLPSL